MEDRIIDYVQREAERHTKSKDEWRKAAIVSLAVGNGGGLAALAAWSARLEEFTQAVDMFLPSMWVYTGGLICAGALPFAAWSTSNALSEGLSARRDRQIAKTIQADDFDSLSERTMLEVRAGFREEAVKYLRPSIYALRALLTASIICFLAGTFLALWTVSTSRVFQSASGSMSVPAADGDTR